MLLVEVCFPAFAPPFPAYHPGRATGLAHQPFCPQSGF